MMRIMFVDDEPNILSGLRRILRPQRKQWDMLFEESAATGLDALAEQPCDVIVSDMKMPGMDGAEFLSHVKAEYPSSIRIALSGETDTHMIYRCVQNAHQYMAKPCDIDTLIATIQRAFDLRDLMQDEKLEAIVAEMTSLPSLPETYDEIMRELQSEDPSLQVVGEIIESDVAMTAKILQLVNSAFFGLARELSSPSEAAMYLGVDVLRSLVLTSGVFSQFEVDEETNRILRSVWDHSIQVGALAKSIMETQTNEKLLADYALMGGLLSDVGTLILATNKQQEFQQSRALMLEKSLPDYVAEKESIGHSHMEVGAYLVGLWGLPNPVVECVAFHHAPGNCAGAELTPLAAVHVANAIVHANGGTSLEQLDKEFVEKIGVSEKIPDWIEIRAEANGAGVNV